MKKLIVFFITISFTITTSTYAQVNFEGMMKWSITMKGANGTASSQQELTPHQKEELNKNIADLEKKLNDPSMKPLFDNNPSLKLMMEQQLATMKTMQGGDGMNSLLPKSYTIKFKDGNSYTQVDGGALAAAGDILYLKATDKTYYIKKTAKTYSITPKAKPAANDATTTVTATTETTKVLTYTCTKYIVTFTEAGKTKTMFVWATKDLKQYSSSSFQSTGIGSQSNTAALKKIDGVPLKIEMTDQGQTVIIQVIELKNTAIPTTDFILPLDYKEVPFGQ